MEITEVLKICVIGPECTGKSTLSKALANHYNTSWVPEYARVYLDKLGRSYNESDLIKIAQGQIRLEQEWLNESNRLLVIDTNLLVVKIWSEHKFGVCDPEIIHFHKSRVYDHYLLTDIDVPWENDPQREHPDLRKYFFDLYLSLISESGVPFTVLSGSHEVRIEKAISIIDILLLQKENLKPSSK